MLALSGIKLIGGPAAAPPAIAALVGGWAAIVATFWRPPRRSLAALRAASRVR